MLQGFVIMEAIHSCAMEHPNECACDVCKAAAGDVRAFSRVWDAVAQDAGPLDPVAEVQRA